MTFTPDRRKRKAGQRARRATLAPRVRAARKQAMKHNPTTPADTPDTGHSGTTLAGQLKDAGLDLTLTQPVHVAGDAHHPVAIMARKIGADQEPADPLGLVLGTALAHEDVAHIGGQTGGGSPHPHSSLRHGSLISACLPRLGAALG